MLLFRVVDKTQKGFDKSAASNAVVSGKLAAFDCTKGTAAHLSKSRWRAEGVCTYSDERKDSITTACFSGTNSIDNQVDVIDGHVAKFGYLRLVESAKMSEVVPSDERVQVRAEKIRAEDIVYM